MYCATHSDRLLDGYAPRVLLEERMGLMLSRVPGETS